MEETTIICRCEEVTWGEIKIALDAGLLRPGDIRKFTRAGMGTCQGRTCQRPLMREVKRYINSLGVAEESITARTPVQAVTLKELACWDEVEENDR